MSDLREVPSHQLLGALIDRGFTVKDGCVDLCDAPDPDIERLAELIATGRIDEALQALHDITPAAPRPATIKNIIAARAAEPPRRVS
ncbi:hypothetical protein [Jiella marina]|uniref:hypothetical protein n=1 Tax=Jiella sp. LLJ827 TaxID=2917712 RepID=UPI0021018155|nr:hypothetical protein [Jiella sp. LLJ827]MCQ0987519.1 hypothetical protein [Jiella sp. LLJ827]